MEKSIYYVLPLYYSNDLYIFAPINRNFMVTCFDVCEILEMLSEASVKVFLDGGWGIDALIGRETRIHNDIDLFVEKKDYGKAISVITWKGYREVVMDYTTDSHTVWKDDNGRISPFIRHKTSR